MTIPVACQGLGPIGLQIGRRAEQRDRTGLGVVPDGGVIGQLQTAARPGLLTMADVVGVHCAQAGAPGDDHA